MVHLADRERLHESLTGEGYKIEDDTPDSEMIYARGEPKLDLLFIVERDGQIVSPGWEHWPWPADSVLFKPYETPPPMEGAQLPLLDQSNGPVSALRDCRRGSVPVLGRLRSDLAEGTTVSIHKPVACSG